MRKISPDGIRHDFKTQLSDLRSFYSAGMFGLTKQSDQSMLTEHSLLAAAIAWEGFVSDLFVAYINVDADRFKVHLKDSFQAHIDNHDKSSRVFEKFGQLCFPAHLSKADVQLLANSMGNNITFSNFSDLEKRASTWLIKDHADKFRNLSKSQKATVDAVIALRNHVAHRSQRSFDAMNDALEVGALHTTGIKRSNNKFHNVGAWLKAVPVGKTQSRLSMILGGLEAISASC